MSGMTLSLLGTITVKVSRKAAPKEMSLEATAEDRQRFCSRDVHEQAQA